MARLLNNRSLVFAAAAVILVVTAGAAIAAPVLVPQLVHHTADSQTLELPPTAVAANPGRPGGAPVQLSSQDLTPPSPPRHTASRFLGREPLNSTISVTPGKPDHPA